MGVSAGQKLRKEFDDALARASKELGRPLVWDEHEEQSLDAAANAADRREQLANVYAAELVGEKRPSILVKLSGEMRLLERAAADFTRRVQIGPGVAKSARHQAAVKVRWDNERKRRGTDG
ncbi:hypothetical protein JRC04_22955 [Mycolicibacterium sp. S2-37]|uniref:hypothetical protein n=1 Tax=Mycolicibacterium sp. S2-37 TaxID=2810297 RepID=UPI001A948060|nr:hypothetical protein [Mycolicibacterium sp. S2-37]MBO0680335.1 hypothetical protein [Mycolicibacterium sp. S2-37]